MVTSNFHDAIATTDVVLTSTLGAARDLHHTTQTIYPGPTRAKVSGKMNGKHRAEAAPTESQWFERHNVLVRMRDRVENWAS